MFESEGCSSCYTDVQNGSRLTETIPFLPSMLHCGFFPGVNNLLRIPPEFAMGAGGVQEQEDGWEESKNE